MLRFGLFEFDANAGALSREGVPVRLQPQPARVLAVLVSRPGEIVTRETLKQEVWGDGTFVDFERGLNFCIAQIRSALGDSADSPRFVETLPKRGYRFIAPVAGLLQDHADSEERLRPERGAQSPNESERGWAASAKATASVAEAKRRRGPASLEKSGPDVATHPAFRRRSLIWAALALSAVTGALVIGAWRAPSVDARVRVAVVPFDNETGEDGFDRIARGVADATVARLATPDRLRILSVIGNAAALHQPRGFRDLQRIGTELGAEYIVLAQMKSDAAGVRLIAHLIRVPDQVHVWANTYDRPVFTLDAQAEIAESIASSVTRSVQSPSHRTASN